MREIRCPNCGSSTCLLRIDAEEYTITPQDEIINTSGRLSVIGYRCDNCGHLWGLVPDLIKKIEKHIAENAFGPITGDDFKLLKEVYSTLSKLVAYNERDLEELAGF